MRPKDDMAFYVAYCSKQVAFKRYNNMVKAVFMEKNNGNDLVLCWYSLNVQPGTYDD